MRKKLTVVPVLLVLLAISVSACGPNATLPPSIGSLVPTVKAAGSLVPTLEAAAGTLVPTAEAAGSLVPTLESAASAVPSLIAGTPGASTHAAPVEAAQVKVQDFPPLGPVLVDADGQFLYMYKGDTQNGGTSACESSECLKNWEPLLTNGDPVAGDGVEASMLGTITLSSGLVQVTYNGWPLYHFLGLGKPGAASGQGFKDQWFVMGPDGNPITTKLPGAAETSPAASATPTP